MTFDLDPLGRLPHTIAALATSIAVEQRPIYLRVQRNQGIGERQFHARTPEQTALAIFYSDNFILLWNELCAAFQTRTSTTLAIAPDCSPWPI
jgi:hypothetical protein